MAEPFLGELRIFSFNFAPQGWAMCNGQLLPINQNQALFSILGTTYGGNGQTTFGLPNLRGQVPMHVGAGHVQGEQAGQESHTVTINEFPTHTHLATVSQNNGTLNSPATNFLAAAAIYGPVNNFQPINPQTVTNTGGSQPHNNMQPYLVLNICIALQGIFPSRN